MYLLNSTWFRSNHHNAQFRSEKISSRLWTASHRRPTSTSSWWAFSIYLPTYLPIHLPTYLLTYVPTYLLTYQPIYLPMYLPIYLPTNVLPRYLPTYISTYLHIYLPIILLTYLPTYLPIYLTTYLSTDLYTNLPIYLLTYLPTYLSTYLPVCLPTNQGISCAMWPNDKIIGIQYEIIHRNTLWSYILVYNRRYHLYYFMVLREIGWEIPLSISV